jgi:hypothetical protein
MTLNDMVLKSKIDVDNKVKSMRKVNLLFIYIYSIFVISFAIAVGIFTYKLVNAILKLPLL